MWHISEEDVGPIFSMHKNAAGVLNWLNREKIVLNGIKFVLNDVTRPCSTDIVTVNVQGPLLLTWVNFNASMDK